MNILYLILTTKHQPDRQHNQLQTWLKSEKYLYVSDINGNHTKQFSTNDTYSSNEEKQINSINYVILNHQVLDYDWYCFCDNDTFIFTDNVKKALKNCDPNKVHGKLFNKKTDPENPIFNRYGENFNYCSGGAGYFISRQLIRKLPILQNYNAGFGDVSFGLNGRDLKFEFCDLEGCNPDHFGHDKYKNNKHADQISYHYVKRLEDFIYLYQLKNVKNVISFSLWGDKEKYRFGAFENIKLAKEVYPEWKLRFYINEDIELNFAKRLYDEGAEVFKTKKGLGAFEGMYWRFWVNDDLSVKKYCIRDADSRLNWRERAAVDEWLSSDKPFHIMRDHKNHIFPIQGGLWGGTTGIITNLTGMITSWNQYDRYSCDQFFLANRLYPLIKDRAMVHCTYMEKKPFPPHKPLDHPDMFVGQIFDENNKFYSE